MCTGDPLSIDYLSALGGSGSDDSGRQVRKATPHSEGIVVGGNG
jgi:hypothetical protein